MVMHIKYSATCKINIFGRQIKFFIFLPIKANKKLKFLVNLDDNIHDCMYHNCYNNNCYNS